MKRLCLLLALLAVPVLCRADPAGVLVKETGGAYAAIHSLIFPVGTFSSTAGVGTVDSASTAPLGGAVPIVNSTAGVTLTTAQGYGYTVFATGVGDVDLPDVCDSATGANVCVYVRDVGEVVSVAPQAEDTIVFPGVATLIAGDELDSAGVAGDFVCLACLATNTWYTMGASASWADGGPAD